MHTCIWITKNTLATPMGIYENVKGYWNTFCTNKTSYIFYTVDSEVQLLWEPAVLNLHPLPALHSLHRVHFPQEFPCGVSMCVSITVTVLQLLERKRLQQGYASLNDDFCRHWQLYLMHKNSKSDTDCSRTQAFIYSALSWTARRGAHRHSVSWIFASPPGQLSCITALFP